MVTLTKVESPPGPKPYPASVLVGEGFLPNQRWIRFLGERREMIEAAAEMGDHPVRVVIEDTQVLALEPLCSCGHALRAHLAPSAPREPFGACTSCPCREAWPMEVA